MSKGFSLLGRGKAQDKTAAEDDAAETGGEDERQAPAETKEATTAPASEPAPEKGGGNGDGGAQAAGKVVDIESARAEAYDAAAEVTALCTLAGKPELAAGFLEAKKAPAEVRVALLEAQAAEAEATGVHGQHAGGTDTHAARQSAWDRAFAAAAGRQATS